MGKESVARSHRQFRYIDHQISTVHLPELSRLFDADIKEFNEVWNLRKKRDATTDQRLRKNIISQERRRMQSATAIPSDIAAHCLKVGEYALYAYRNGYRAVRGDSGAAISSACAGALTAAFVIGTNLSRFSIGRWHSNWSAKASELETDAVAMINEAIMAVETIRRSVDQLNEPQLNL